MTKSQSLERGLDVVEALNASPRPMGTRELARALGLSPAIVQRLLNTLAERHYVRQDPDTRRYTIGYQMVTIGFNLQTSDLLLAEGRRELMRLVAEMKVDAYLGVLRRNAVMYLLCVTGEGPVTVKTQPGQTVALHSTALGKVFLASKSDDEALALLGKGPLPALTERTVTDPYRLLMTLDEVRANGFAVAEDENILGISSVGAPVRNAAGEVCAAISVSFSRYFGGELDLPAVDRIVRRSALAISSAIGRGSG